MDDFKRPLSQQPPEPNSPFQSSEPDPMPPTSEPMQVKKKGGAKKWLLWGVVVLLLAGLGAFGYWQWTEAENAKKEAESAKQELATLKGARTEDTAEPTDSDLTTKDRIELATSTYGCNVPGLGACDKLVTTVTKTQESKGSEPGFATATIVLPNSESGTTAYLRSVDNLNWVVVWDGQGKPPQDVVDKFDIPASFVPAS